MNLIDIVLGLLLVLGVVSGVKEGLVRQVAGLAGLIAGIVLGRMWYLRVADELNPILGLSERTTQVVAFILILILVPLALSAVAWLISKLLSSVGLGGINRLLGALFGALKYAVLAGLLITALESFDAEGHFVSMKQREESALYKPIHSISDVMLKEVKEQIKKWKEEDKQKEQDEEAPESESEAPESESEEEEIILSTSREMKKEKKFFPSRKKIFPSSYSNGSYNV
ncbi:MAG: CvpA family protein [Bacteroidaceae bacterium]|nr:CvpA family protein [Bacteroidaceae bacterium]